MKAASSSVSIHQVTPDKDGTMQPTVDYTVTRLRSSPAMASGPFVLVAVLAIVIVVLAAGLAAVLLVGPDPAAVSA